jgi:hypothetical protein
LGQFWFHNLGNHTKMSQKSAEDREKAVQKLHPALISEDDMFSNLINEPNEVPVVRTDQLLFSLFHWSLLLRAKVSSASTAELAPRQKTTLPLIDWDLMETEILAKVSVKQMGHDEAILEFDRLLKENTKTFTITYTKLLHYGKSSRSSRNGSR